ncbi:hypothetical protein IFVP5_C290048 [Vibrio parahaemolyticus]
MTKNSIKRYLLAINMSNLSQDAPNISRLLGGECLTFPLG